MKDRQTNQATSTCAETFSMAFLAFEAISLKVALSVIPAIRLRSITATTEASPSS
jgi:hypothetical protein